MSGLVIADEAPASDLVARAKAGEREAFDMLVERYLSETYRLATGIVGRVDARDVTQETFVAAWQEIGRLRKPEAFPAWLRRICVNRSRNWLRRRKSRGPTASLDMDDELADRLPDRRTDFRGAVEARMVLEPLFDQLKPDQRLTVVLHYGMGYSIAETAEASGVRTGTAKSRLNAALKRLRRALEDPHETSHR